MAVIVAVAMNTDVRREILGITVMPSEAVRGFRRATGATVPVTLLVRLASRSLTRRGLRGVQMVISDAHEGLKAAASKVLGAGWQRCRVHFQRNLLARVSKANKPVVSAVVKTVFAETDRDRAHARWREVADSLRERFRDVAELMDTAGYDVLAYMAFDESLRTKLHSTNPLERVNTEIKRRTNVVGLGGQSVHWTARLSASLPNRDAVVRLVGALMLEQNDEWALSRRYMPVEKLTALCHHSKEAATIAAQ